MEQLLIKKYRPRNNSLAVKMVFYMGEHCEHKVQLQ
jgi:hypothetical protein